MPELQPPSERPPARPHLTESIASQIQCPDCRLPLEPGVSKWVCHSCHGHFPVENGILNLLGDQNSLNQNEIETQDHVSDFYENVRYKEPNSQKYHRHMCEQILSWAGEDGLILDNGCGNGWFYEILGARAKALNAVGLDVSGGMLRLAEGRISNLVRGDSCRLPFKDNTFDTVIAKGLLHHLPDPSKGVAEIRRVLKPGGRFVAYEPNRNFISRLPRLLANRTAHFDDDHRDFPFRELKDLIGSQFQIDRVKFSGYLAYPLLSFPDLINFSKFLPLAPISSFLIRFDDWVSRVPILRRLSWGVLVRGVKHGGSA